MKRENTKLYISAFSGALFILLFSYAVVHIFPFGDKALLTIDLSHQYVDFYSFLRQSFFGDKGNLLYSLSTALGGDTFGLTSYYLLSPLNIIILIFPEGMILEAVLLMTLVKAGLCSVFFAFFITKELNVKSYWLRLAFSLMYGLCSYSVVYAMCPMWIDALILLPVVAAGAGEISRGKSPLIFCVSLVITIISNYYTGYMVCLFIALYYICISISASDTLRELLKRLCRFGIFAFFSGLCCAFLLIPVISSLKSGRMGYYATDLSMSYDFTPVEFLSKLFAGYSDTVKTTNSSNGLPNIYSGVLCVLGLPMYFLNKKFSLKEKNSFGTLIFILCLSMFLNPVNLLWHGMQEPYWYPYRYSFVLSFALLVVSLKGLINVAELSKKQLISSVVIGLVPYAVGAFAAPVYFVVLTAVFAGIYILLILKKARPVFLFLVVFGEMVISTSCFAVTIDLMYKYEKRSSYTDYTANLKEVLADIKDDSLYRTEKTVARSRNDNMSLYINGISHYSSTFSSNVNSFIKSMGFLQSRTWTKYKGATPLTDSVLGIKYLISDTENPFYEKISEKNGYYLYKNNYALPLAFLSDGNLGTFSLSSNPFENQQNFLDEICGEKTNALIKQEYEKSDLSYSVMTSEAGALYFYFSASSAYQCDLYVNGKLIGNYFRDYIYKDNNYNIVYAGNFKQGERVNIRLVPPENTSMNVDEAYFYCLDNANLISALSSIEKAEVTQVSATEYKINVKSDRDTVLMTTIPLSGFSVTVNGDKSKAIHAAGTFYAFDIKAGETTVIMKYCPHNFKTGIIITMISLILLIAFLLLDKKNRNKKGHCKYYCKFNEKS